MSYQENPDKIDERKLRPASENIWYALATIAGEPKSNEDEDIIKQNRHYWNGYMRSRLSDEGYENLKDKDGQQIELPILSQDEKIKIQAELKARGFTEETLLYGQIDFKDTDFPYVNFKGVTFLGKAFFEGATFSEKADFEGTKFMQEAKFNGVMFTEWTVFKGATFVGLADFKGAAFADFADFKGAAFSEGAVFNGATFVDWAVFDGAAFADFADFKGTTFWWRAHFKGTTFSDMTYFNGVTFMSVVNFNSATFKDSLNFGPLEKGKTTYFKNYPPLFFEAKISESISWTDVDFPDVKGFTRLEADKHKDVYERLGLMMDKLKKHHDQHMFFRLEMKARRKMETHWFPRFMNWAYEIFSDYGYDIERATKWWLGNILLGALLLIPYKGLKFDFSVSGFWEGLGVIGTALITSFSNAHGFLGLGRGPLQETISAYQSNSDLLIPYNATATAQTILGVIFLFFVILTARNRFRMG